MKSSQLKMNTRAQRGAVMIEFAIALPLFLLVTYAGFEVLELTSQKLARNDIVRSLALSYQCSNLQDSTDGSDSPAKFCFKRVSDTLVSLIQTKYPNAQLAVQAFSLTNASQGVRASGSCSYNAIKTHPITRTAAYIPPGFPLKYGSAQISPSATVGNILGPGDVHEGLQLCLNNQIMIVELNLRRRPTFDSILALFGNYDNSERTYNEYAFL